jgi:hypothetical protein
MKKRRGIILKKQKKSQSTFDILRGRILTKNEPHWLKLIMYIILISFWIFVVCKIGLWTISLLGFSNLKSVFSHRPPL